MNIARFATKRPVTVLMGVLATIVLGIIGFRQIPLDFLPDFDVPIVSVITVYSGTPPEEIEEFVTKPIEEAVATVDNYKGIRSVSQEGVSVVTVEFEWGQDMDWASFDVREKVDAAINQLPGDAERPLIFRIDPSVFAPVAVVDITGMDDMRDLRQLADDRIKPELEKIEGVAAVDLYGGLQRQIRVEVDWQRLSALDMDVSTISNALRAENVNIPGGWITEGDREFTIRTVGEFEAVDELNDVIVDVVEGQPIYLSDVADVRDHHEEVRSYARFNGKPSVSLSVRKESGANTVKVSEAVTAAMDRLPETLPPGLELNLTSDSAEATRDSLDNLFSVARQGAILAVIIIFLFLSTVSGTFVVGVAIPLAVLATMAFMYLYGMTLNIVTMGGLILAIGRMVDDSVVVLENIFRHLEDGEPVLESCVSGTRELAMAIAGATFTDICVFVPLLFVGGFVDILFSDMSLVVIVGLFSSLVVSVTVVPMFASRLLRQPVDDEDDVTEETPVQRMWNTVAAPMRMIVGIWNRMFDGIEKVYTRAVRWSLRNRAITLAIAGALFLSTLVFASLLGFSFFPTMDQGEFTVEVEAPIGSSIEHTNQLTRQVEDIINDLPEVEHVGSTVGEGGGALGQLQGSGVRGANVQVKLVDLDDRERGQTEIENALRERFAKMPGVTTRIRADRGPGGADLEVTITGDELDVLSDFGEELQEKAGNITGLSDLNLDWEAGSPEYEINIDREKAGQHGLTARQIADTVQTQVFGTTNLTKFREAGEEYDIQVRGAMNDRNSIADIRQVSILAPGEHMVPLENVADVRMGEGPTQISRKDRQRSIALSASVSERALSEVVAEIEGIIDQMNLPDDYSYEFGGSEEDRRESFAGMQTAFLLGLMLIFIILASQFESVIHPFVIMLAIPLELIGVVAALLITNTYFSMMVFLGLLMLTGMVVSNAILVVQLIVLLRERGIDGREGIAQAGERRLRPILMTTITTIIAMVPVALNVGQGNEMWQPLGVAVIGGLFTSTFLTLFIVPVAFSVVDDVIAWVYGLLGKEVQTA